MKVLMLLWLLLDCEGDVEDGTGVEKSSSLVGSDLLQVFLRLDGLSNSSATRAAEVTLLAEAVVLIGAAEANPVADAHRLNLWTRVVLGVDGFSLQLVLRAVRLELCCKLATCDTLRKFLDVRGLFVLLIGISAT